MGCREAPKRARPVTYATFATLLIRHWWLWSYGFYRPTVRIIGCIINVKQCNVNLPEFPVAASSIKTRTLILTQIPHRKIACWVLFIFGSIFWYRRHAAQRSAIVLFRWLQFGLGTLCRRESGLLHQSSRSGWKRKLTYFHSHFVLCNAVMDILKQSIDTTAWTARSTAHLVWNWMSAKPSPWQRGSVVRMSVSLVGGLSLTSARSMVDRWTLSAMGQPTRHTQPSIPPRSVNK